MKRKPPAGAGLLVLLKPYRWLIAALVVLTVAGNGLNLAVPKIISHAIDAYTQQTFVMSTVVLQFIVVAAFVFTFTYLQSVVQVYASERVARDLRTRVAAKISVQSYAYVEQVTPAKLLTNLTSDIDGVKLFVSQAIASIISSVFLILGAGILLLSINWRLGLSVLCVVPFIAITFQTGVAEGAAAVQKGPGSDRLAEPRDQRKHHGLGAHPAAQHAATRVRQVPGGEYGGEGYRSGDAAAVCRHDPGDHVRDQSGDRDHSPGGRALRHRGQHEPGRFYGVQLVLIHPDLSDHSHRIHEQRDCAGDGVLPADRSNLECSGGTKDRRAGSGFARRYRPGKCVPGIRGKTGAAQCFPGREGRDANGDHRSHGGREDAASLSADRVAAAYVGIGHL